MIRATAIELISAPDTAGIFETVTATTRRVFAEVRSPSSREFYTAHEQGLEPTFVFILADYAEYKGEQYVDYNGARYRVIRTYENGQKIEITVERSKVVTL